MNQENIGKFIRENRKKMGLSQAELAEKLGVTYQAVSKWENGKNLPDMLVLKELSDLFNVNIDEILNGKEQKKKSNKTYLIIIISILIIFLSTILIIIIHNKDNSFSYNEIKSNHSDFNVFGSVVQSSDRTLLTITDVEYSGNDNNNKYKSIECNLYEALGDTSTKINSCEEGKNVTLQEYLKGIKIKIDHHQNNCTMFKKTQMYLEINATDDNNKVIAYKIPIEINNDDCN